MEYGCITALFSLNMSLAVAARSIDQLDQLDQLDKLVASAGFHRLAERRHAMPRKRTRAKQEEREYNYGYKPGKKNIEASGLVALLGPSADQKSHPHRIM